MSAQPLWKTYLAILAPMALSSVLQAAAGTADAVYLGRMLGVHALAAVAAFFPVFFFLLSAVMGISAGATVLVARAWGAGDRAQVRAVAGTAVCLVYGAGAAVALVGAFAVPQLVHALGTPVVLVLDATRYARLMLLATPLIFVMWLLTSLSRGVGDALTPLRTLALATALALVCTPALIRGWFGLPHLGVESAAVSTVVAFALALTWMLVHAYRTDHPLAPRLELLRAVRVDARIARTILRIGIPTSLTMMTMALADSVLLGLVNRHGAAATAAYGAVTQAMGWVQMPALSLGITASILASHAIGAKRTDRLDAIVATGIRLNFAVTGTAAILVFAFAPLVVRLFVADDSVAALATVLLRTVVWSVVFLGIATTLGGVLRANGTVLVPTLLTIAAIVCLELPTAYALNARMGLAGIWWSYTIAFAAMPLLQACCYRGLRSTAVRVQRREGDARGRKGVNSGGG